MRTITINDELFDALGAEGAEKLSAIMLEKRLVDEEVEIKGDASVAMPDLSTKVYGMDISESLLHTNEEADVGAEFKIKLPKIKIPSFICKAGCDAAAAGAVAALTLTGPGLAAALAVIAVAREECRRRC